ncbi:MAG TPA: Fe-S cluster assembly protein SufB [Candidatus Dojkabacteria bacterium]|nr:Fe-S cluster assembly protein SufB [Candidatus Dojkabacteria bacterium]
MNRKTNMSPKIDKSNVIFPKGLTEETVRLISKIKEEPEWMLKIRLEAFHTFESMKNPKWGIDLSEIDCNNIKYYAYAGEKSKSWDDIPKDIKDTFDKLGLPETEQKYLAGLTTQYESEAIYHNLKSQWQEMGIIFEDTDTALKKYPEYFNEYFGKLVPYTDNKYAALNTAVWSGGTFIYVPKGVKLWMPVQTYFRINMERMGQFERTLIIADDDSQIHYIEGCTAPQYVNSSLHSAIVEIYVKNNAKVRYTTLQNWSKNVYNLVTKRAITHKNGVMEWVDCNIGSRGTMKYPSVVLYGDNSHAELLSMAMASKDQNIDSGGKMIHIGKNTTSIINSKTISKENGVATYRGLSKITQSALNSRSKVDCQSLVVDKDSKSYSYPVNTVSNKSSILEHEASISRLSSEKIYYLMCRGFTQEQATKLILSGFIQDITDQLPMEYAVELERLLELF